LYGCVHCLGLCKYTWRRLSGQTRSQDLVTTPSQAPPISLRPPHTTAPALPRSARRQRTTVRYPRGTAGTVGDEELQRDCGVYYFAGRLGDNYPSSSRARRLADGDGSHLRRHPRRMVKGTTGSRKGRATSSQRYFVPTIAPPCPASRTGTPSYVLPAYSKLIANDPGAIDGLPKIFDWPD
jgi:hypothetical protein